MKKYKLLSIVAAFVLSFLAASNMVMANEYRDTKDHYAKESVKRWSEYGVVNGYQGFFRPNDKITRGELAVILNRILSYRNQFQVATNFSDLENKFYTQSVLALNEQGILKGNNNALRPNDTVTREEAAVLLVRAFGLEGKSAGVVAAKDGSEVSVWAKDAITLLMEQQFMKGYEGKVFPKNNLTRAEIVTLLDNMIGQYIDKSGEYEVKQPSNPNQLIIIRAGDVKIKGSVPFNNLILSASKDLTSVYLENAQVKELKILDRADNLILLLEKSKVENLVQKEEKTTVYADQSSEIKSGSRHSFASKDLAEGIKQLQEKKLDFIKLPQVDEVQPRYPETGETITPPAQNEVVDSTDFLVGLPELENDQVIYFTAGNAVILPESVILLKKSNGESTATKVGVKWQSNDIEAIRQGKAGNYTVVVETKTEFTINETNYTKVRFTIKMVIR